LFGLCSGKTKQDLLDRQADHRLDARNNPEKYGFKKDIKLELEPGMDGLTDDEMIGMSGACWTG
jgi:hypothetical protein